VRKGRAGGLEPDEAGRAEEGLPAFGKVAAHLIEDNQNGQTNTRLARLDRRRGRYLEAIADGSRDRGEYHDEDDWTAHGELGANRWEMGVL
jgi:hypothetical protein